MPSNKEEKKLVLLFSMEFFDTSSTVLVQLMPNDNKRSDLKHKCVKGKEKYVNDCGLI